MKFIQILTCYSALVLSLCSTNVLAQWTGGVEAGTQLGSNSNPTLRFYARNQAPPMTHYLFLDWTRGDDATSYRIGYNPRYNMSQSFYSFGRFSLKRDEPSGIDSDLYGLVGLGNHMYRNKTSLLTIELGAGARQLELSNSTTDADTEGLLYLGSRFTTKIIDLLRFDIEVDSTIGESETVSGVDAGISIRIGPNSSLRYGYQFTQYKFDDARPDIDDEDSFFTVSYGF